MKNNVAIKMKFMTISVKLGECARCNCHVKKKFYFWQSDLFSLPLFPHLKTKTIISTFLRHRIEN